MRRVRPLSITLAVALALIQGLAGPGAAAPFAGQTPGGPGSAIVPVQAQNWDRKCQTIRNCRFTQGGSFRGCVSSYSCRACRFVPANCSIGSTTGVCRRQVCDWGG